MAGISVDEWDRKIQKWIRGNPVKVGEALEAVVARDMVKHARAKHPKWKASRGSWSGAGRSGGFSWSRGEGRGRAKVTDRYQTRTGILSQAIQAGKAMVSAASREISVLFSALVDYAYFIEYGTRHHPAFPFMRPAVEANRSKLKERIQAAMIKWGDEMGVR